jgi:hypothetical protein
MSADCIMWGIVVTVVGWQAGGEACFFYALALQSLKNA